MYYVYIVCRCLACLQGYTPCMLGTPMHACITAIRQNESTRCRPRRAGLVDADTAAKESVSATSYVRVPVVRSVARWLPSVTIPTACTPAPTDGGVNLFPLFFYRHGIGCHLRYVHAAHDREITAVSGGSGIASLQSVVADACGGEVYMI